MVTSSGCPGWSRLIPADLVACGSHVAARKHQVGRCEPACAGPAGVAYRGAVDCAEQLVDPDARLADVPKVG
jgi:hypothetical protein